MKAVKEVLYVEFLALFLQQTDSVEGLEKKTLGLE